VSVVGSGLEPLGTTSSATARFVTGTLTACPIETPLASAEIVAVGITPTNSRDTISSAS